MPSKSYLDDNSLLVYHLDYLTQWGQNSKMMVLPKYMKIVQALNERIIEDDLIESLLNPPDECFDQVLKSPKTVSKISKFFDNFDVSSLESVFFGNQQQLSS